MVDLATLVNHYLGLRQEVNLQTRAVRAQQEQSAAALAQLQQAVELLSRGQARAEQADRDGRDEKLRPLVQSLVDLHDALSLAAPQLARSQAGAAPLLDQVADALRPEEAPPAPPPPPPPRASLWQRWFSSPPPPPPPPPPASAPARDREQALRACEQVRAALDALVAGYRLSLQRVERALAQQGLEAIPAVGRPFDPEQMEALGWVAGSGRPAGEVVEEARRGYRWQGRVFRYAQVRVARDSAPPPAEAPASHPATGPD